MVTPIVHIAPVSSVSCPTSLGLAWLGLALRWLVLGGSSLGLLFSYYRHPPLLISLKWLTLTLILNTALLAVLSNEREEAEELAKDPEKVSAP